MRSALFAVAIISVVNVTGVVFAEEPVSDFAKFQGTWRGTNPDGAILNLTIDGNTFKTLVKVKSNTRNRPGSYTVEHDFMMDETANPKEIDFLMTDDNGDEKTVMAIYKLKADKLTICMGRTGKKRPTKFDGGNEGGTMVVYNRYPKAKSTDSGSVGKMTSNSIVR